MTGHVTLVGAGPGDKGLLTLRGAQAIAGAEVIVFDRLVGADILSMMPETAEQINVGKESRNHTMPQEEINLLLVRKAQEGKRVVRLKGGDCYLFGRGGEETEALAAFGVPFEVVPGVTSALSVPAYAGIPVTHRDFCSSVHIVTAHARAGGALSIDFESLTRLNGTLVFLMGVAALPVLMEGLLAAGMSAEMPAAVIESGTRYNQRKLVGTVGTLTRRAEEEAIKSPAVIIVGRVCTLSDTLDWFSAQPLHGKRIVVTRPKERSGTLADKLRALGAGVTEYPCIETEQMPEAALPQDFSAYTWCVLTSPAGVPALCAALYAHGTDMRALFGLKFACIGNGTAAELAKLGIRADYVPESFDAKHLAEGLRSMAKPGDRLLLLRAEQGTEELTDILAAHAVAFDDVAIYRTRYRSAQSAALAAEIEAGQVAAVTFTSASTVRGFLQATPGADVSRFIAVCIGQSTANEAKQANMRVKIAANATIDAMVTCILEGI